MRIIIMRYMWLSKCLDGCTICCSTTCEYLSACWWMFEYVCVCVYCRLMDRHLELGQPVGPTQCALRKIFTNDKLYIVWYICIISLPRLYIIFYTGNATHKYILAADVHGTPCQTVETRNALLVAFAQCAITSIWCRHSERSTSSRCVVVSRAAQSLLRSVLCVCVCVYIYRGTLDIFLTA